MKWLKKCEDVSGIIWAKGYAIFKDEEFFDFISEDDLIRFFRAFITSDLFHKLLENKKDRDPCPLCSDIIMETIYGELKCPKCGVIFNSDSILGEKQ